MGVRGFVGWGASARRTLALGALFGAMLGLGGCWWHDSLVPAIGEQDRAGRSPFRSGVYCSLEAEAEGLALSEECARLEWDRDARQLTVTEIQEDGELGDELWLDVANMGRGLVLLQNPVLSDEGRPPRYELFAILARREGYAMIPLPAPATRDAIARQEGLELEPSEGPSDYGAILSGEPAAVRRTVERSAFAWLDSTAGAGEEGFEAYDPDPQDENRRPAYSIRLEWLGDDYNADELDRAADRLREALLDKAED